MSFFNKLAVVASSILVLTFTMTLLAQNDDVVAVVGNKQITKKEFNDKYKEVVSKAFNPPTKDLFLEDLVRYEVGVMEAQKRNLGDDPIVQERIRQVMYIDLVEKEIGKKADAITVSEKEMQAYYAKNPEIRTSHILVEVKENARKSERDAAKKRAAEIYKEVSTSKKPFEQLVKLYSDDVISKKNGGDIGWHSSTTLLPEFYVAALKLSEGQLSPLVETKFGFHIIKLTGKKSYKDADKVRLNGAVKESKKRLLFDEFFGKLKSKYNVKTYTQKL
ncbi:MAG: peptidylprolyl isomerase [Bdellovibrionota bacterium]